MTTRAGDYRIFGAGTGYKTVSLGEFDAWLDAQAQGKLHDGDTSEVYKNVAWAFRCLQLRANAVSAMPYTVTRMGGEDPIDSPWPLTRLLWTTEAALCTWGCYYWLKQANRVKTVRLQWLNPTTMKVERDTDGISGFTQRVGTSTLKFTPEQIVYGRLWNPNDDLGPGTAPLEVALEAAGIARYVNQWAEAFFSHGAVPTVILHTDNTLPKGEAERIQSSWQRMTAGIANAWKAIVTQAGLEPTVITPPVNTLALPELSSGVRAQIAVAMGVPETMIADAANYATAKEHKQSFLKDTIVPECALIEEVVNEQLFNPAGLQFTFQPEELTEFQEDEKERSISLYHLQASGVPLRTALEILGYDLTEEQWEEIDEASQLATDEKRQKLELDKLRAQQPQIIQQGGGGWGRERMTGITDTEGGPPPMQKALVDDLRLWRRVAVKRFKDGEKRAFDFKSDAIPPHIKTAISFELSGCEDVESVKAVFAPYLQGPGDYAPLVAALTDATRALCATRSIT